MGVLILGIEIHPSIVPIINVCLLFLLPPVVFLTEQLLVRQVIRKKKMRLQVANFFKVNSPFLWNILILRKYKDS